LEYVLFKPFGAIDTPLEAFSFLIAAITNIACIILFVVSMVWWWKLRQSKVTDFGGWFLGTALVMAGIWFWSATGMAQIAWFDMTVPNISLPARIAILFGVCFKVWKATRCRPMPHNELNDLRERIGP
jgi:hypothetical protein